MNTHNLSRPEQPTTGLPPAFQAQMQTQLGVEYPAFANALAQPPPVSIRVNPRKAGKWRSDMKPADVDVIPWCAEGLYLPERPSFTIDPLFQAGAYYVQELLLCSFMKSSDKRPT